MASASHLIQFVFWNAAAAVVFLIPHEIMRGEHVDGFMRPLLVMSILLYLILDRQCRRSPPFGHPLFVPWIRGFHLLFWAEMIMEAVIFTLLDFHETPSNDPYFMAFWACMAFWLLGGWPWLSHRYHQKRRT